VDGLHVQQLSQCAREPIHIPGAIQPYGALAAALADTGAVSHVSANLAAIAGVQPDQVLGTALAGLIGDAAWQSAQTLQAGQPGLALRIDGKNDRTLLAYIHRTGRHLCVEFEPATSAGALSQPLTVVQPMLDSFKTAASRLDLCERAVQGLRRMTGYDRVMAYCFGADGHGEVIAEARDPALPAYLGLRYPATDIPPQARLQYLRQPVGMIADSAYTPVPLMTDPALDDGAPLDLTHARLRSVSPVHRQYMRNMGTAASLTVALTSGEALWGMLVCHHGTPRIADGELRAAADLIGRVVSVFLAGLRSAESAAHRQARAAALRTILHGLHAPKPLPVALAAVQTELLEAAGATGVLMRLSGGVLRFGQVPPCPFDTRALTVLHAAAGDGAIALEDLGLRYPEFGDCAAQAAGAMLVTLGPGTDDAVLWLRPEQAMTLTWGGNPGEHAATEPMTGQISPRTSFAAWQEVVRGKAVAWSDADLELAQEIAHALSMEIALRTRAALEREQAASRAKSAYLAGMSHELRTPLNGILGYAQLLSSEGSLSAVQARRVGAMMAAGTHLLHIIGGVLELSEIEADHAVFDPVAFDARAVAAECLELVRPMAADKHLSLTLDTAPEVPTQIITDPTRFRQILLNLLSNAVKYTNAGHVDLRLRIAADGVSLRIDVIDSGPGIDVAKRHRLFQAFQQLGPIIDAGRGSTGLGLAITARLVALLGGCLGHKENPLGGSIFWLELPLFDAAPVRPLAKPQVAAPAPTPTVRERALRILVADDSGINRDIAHAFLRAAGHQVAFAEDGLEAVAAAAANDFDLILMDVCMPRMSGIEATRKIRALAGPRGRVPIVALTAQVFADQIEECRGASMDEHLAKPFTREGLLAAVDKGLAGRAVAGAEAATQAAPGAPRAFS
jgi:light-regulated signal transduction histidine kinase (bacteriophytochrome)/CheY-like chemotaxis protein